ncbi:LuxR family transcriptional regulator [Streptomyces sp. me109]|nr:LuxR family transcriptional regulator [Streptomyces sp. me109]
MRLPFGQALGQGVVQEPVGVASQDPSARGGEEPVPGVVHGDVDPAQGSANTCSTTRRTAAELRAAGGTTPRTEPGAVDRLTPQEFQIATLISQGLTNPQIADQLFLSPRTIDYHLHKVFAKLHLTSRTQLVRDGLPHLADPAS